MGYSLELNPLVRETNVARKLNSENKMQMWIPQGFAHGFLVLSEEAIFFYKCDNYYSPANESGIKRYDDPFLKIDWFLDKSQIQLSRERHKHACFEKITCGKIF